MTKKSLLGKKVFFLRFFLVPKTFLVEKVLLLKIIFGKQNGLEKEVVGETIFLVKSFF